MLLRIPDFYDSFHCIGGKCPDNCCIGWELDIDDDTYEYYRSLEGPFGDRLRASMSDAEEISENGVNSFHLRVDGRCPFLNDDNLCDICLTLGPDALCRICTDYPRYSFEWGDVIEKSLTLSCPEAGRLLFLNDLPIRFKDISLDDSGLSAYMTDEAYGEMGEETESACIIGKEDTSSAAEFSAEDGDAEYFDEEEDPERISEIARCRIAAIKILQDRTRPIAERAELYLQFCSDCRSRRDEPRWSETSRKTFTDCRSRQDEPRWSETSRKTFTDCRSRQDEPNVSADPNGQNGAECPVIVKSQVPADCASGNEKDSSYDDFRKRIDLLSGMEILNDRWTAIMTGMKETLGPDRETYEHHLAAYLSSEDCRKYEYTYEHLLVYYTFRYFPRAAFDCDLKGKARFALFCYLVIRDMDALKYAEKGSFTFEDRIENAGNFSKQVEHSDYNIDFLMEELLFGI